MKVIQSTDEAKTWFEKGPLSVRCQVKSASKVCHNLEEATEFFNLLNNPPVPGVNAIQMFFHCASCMPDKPTGVSPREWAQLEVGWTAHGFQVWCKRCEKNVVHADFQGAKLRLIE